jgi:UDP-3-O-[3-hydroxymyristoyl] glucosamine N-acyltransferase
VHKTFFTKKPETSLCNVVKHVKESLRIIGDSETIINDIATLAGAHNKDITFYHNTKYQNFLRNTKASACILKEENLPHLPKNIVAVVTKEPQYIYAAIIDYFYPFEIQKEQISSFANIHDTAIVGRDCVIGAGVNIGANVVIGEQVSIGSNSVIEAGVTIGPKTIIGNNATITFCTIGSGCHIFSGVRIGQDGFGFIPGRGAIKHVGCVEIGDDVSIGSNTCVDRGVIGNTIIGNGCKIDNLVQIGHNVELGQNIIIAALVGIAGSAKIEDHVMIGGQSGIISHVRVGKNAKLAGRSGVVRDVKNGSFVGGHPAVSIKSWHRQNIFLKKQGVKTNE